MKISDLVNNHLQNRSLQAKLTKQITLNNGHVFKKGTKSELLIPKDDKTYHFEAQNNACTVKKTEIEFIKPVEKIKVKNKI